MRQIKRKLFWTKSGLLEIAHLVSGAAAKAASSGAELACSLDFMGPSYEMDYTIVVATCFLVRYC